VRKRRARFTGLDFRRVLPQSTARSPLPTRLGLLRHSFLVPALAVCAAHCLGGCTITGPSLLGIAKMIYACIPEGTQIDTPLGPRRIEEIRPGDEVIGYSGAPVKVLQSHSYLEDPLPRRFHRVTFSNGATVALCDQHRICGVRARELEVGSSLAGTSVSSNESYSGVMRSYDLLTEDEGYRIQGVPVNSMIEEMLQAARQARHGGPSRREP